MNESDQFVQRVCKRIFTPPEKVTVVEWCERNLVLSRAVSSKPGRFRAWPWQIEPMNAVLDLNLAALILMWPRQILGKTMVMMGVMGWSISESPCPILVIFQSVEAAALFSKNKLSALLMDTPALGRLVHEDAIRYRKQGAGDATVALKRYPGGFLVLVGPTSSTGVKSHTTKRQFFDEVSSYPITIAGEEGDPIYHATKGAETYPDSFQIFTSTPAIKGTCRITLELEDSDYRKWFVRCPSCKHEWVIMWSDIRWPKVLDAKGKKIHQIENAYLECPACGVHHDDATRQRMALSGRWVATNPGVKNRAGFWANAFICCLAPKRGYRNRLHQWAEEFLKAEKRGTYFLRTFQTTVLSEPYEIDTDPPPGFEHLYNRREHYREHEGEIVLPMKALVLTVGADVQRDRIEAEILATGMDGETWGIEFKVFHGNPEQTIVFNEFDAWAQKKFRHASGHMMWPACICIDSAFKSEAVYRYVKRCGGRKVFATRGDRGFAPLGSNWVDRSKSDNERLWIMKVDGAKESLYSRLRLEDGGAGYQHFPANPKCRYDYEYFRQLTSEVLRTSTSGQRYFAKPTGETRNESLDCRIIASGAVEILDPDYAVIAKKLAMAPANDWRAKEDAEKELNALPIPDLREQGTSGEVNIDALRSSFPKPPKWMTIGK